MKPIFKRSIYLLLIVISILTVSNILQFNTIPAVSAQSSADIQTRRLVVQVSRPMLMPFLAEISGRSVREALSATTHSEVQLSPSPLPGPNASSQFLVYELPQSLSGAALDEAIQVAAGVWGVLSAEPDVKFTAAYTPNDPYFNSDQNSLYGAYGVNAPAAWDITKGSSSVTVAILDTGITDHPDLDARRLNLGYDFISDAVTARDGNGRDADAHDPGDSGSGQSSWHGTHVTGTINAIGNNNTGTAGVSWNSGFVPVRVLGDGGGNGSDLAAAINWAAGLSIAGVPANPTPAKVLNMSLGAIGSCPSYIQAAINNATAAGAVVVVAAGNSTMVTNLFWPANCANVIAVASIDPTSGNHAWYSNYGSGTTVGAPGEGVISTWNNGSNAPGQAGYAYMSGTSMAAPHVSGVVALMLSVNPALNYNSVLSILNSTAKPYPADSHCLSEGCGAGYVDAYAAVQAAKALLVATATSTRTAIANTRTPTATTSPVPASSSCGSVNPYPGPGGVDRVCNAYLPLTLKLLAITNTPTPTPTPTPTNTPVSYPAPNR